LAYKRRGTGNYSMMSLQAIERAESMQALALDRIKQDFGTAESFDVSDGMSYADFVRALTEAEEQGTRDEFEAMLGRQFMAMMQQQAAQAQAQQQGGQTNVG
jgi:hypothetical protein